MPVSLLDISTDYLINATIKSACHSRVLEFLLSFLRILVLCTDFLKGTSDARVQQVGIILEGLHEMSVTCLC